MNPKRITMYNPTTPIMTNTIAPFTRSGGSRSSQLTGVLVSVGLGGGVAVGEGEGVSLGGMLVAAADCTPAAVASPVWVAGMTAAASMIFSACPT